MFSQRQAVIRFMGRTKLPFKRLPPNTQMTPQILTLVMQTPAAYLGIHALEQLGVYYLGANPDRERDAQEAQIPHALEVNNVRLALLGTRTLFQWILEPFIRVLNLSPASSYAMVYDGIAKVFLNSEDVNFAIEYERTLKS